MRNLPATLCLTFAVLLGSEGMSWGAGFEKGIPAFIDWDPLTSMLEWQPLAEQGNADAQYKLGTIYDYWVLRNNLILVKWCKLAAESENISAKIFLDSVHKKGKGVLQIYKTAVKWYRLAAEGVCAEAQFILSSMYFSGNGVSKDRQIARKWWKFSAGRGHPGG